MACGNVCEHSNAALAPLADAHGAFQKLLRKTSVSSGHWRSVSGDVASGHRGGDLARNQCSPLAQAAAGVPVFAGEDARGSSLTDNVGQGRKQHMFLDLQGEQTPARHACSHEVKGCLALCQQADLAFPYRGSAGQEPGGRSITCTGEPSRVTHWFILSHDLAARAAIECAHPSERQGDGREGGAGRGALTSVW